MLDTVGKFGKEIESLTEAYENDSEGLSYREYFNKHASDDYKRYVEETKGYVRNAWEHGVAI